MLVHFLSFQWQDWGSSSCILCGDTRRPSPPVQLAAGRRPSQRLPPQHQDHHRRLLQPHQHIIPHRGPRRHLQLLGVKQGWLSKELSSTAGEEKAKSNKPKSNKPKSSKQREVWQPHHQVNVPPRWVERPTNSSGIPGKRLEIRCRTTGTPSPEVSWIVINLVRYSQCKDNYHNHHQLLP